MSTQRKGTKETKGTIGVLRQAADGLAPLPEAAPSAE